MRAPADSLRERIHPPCKMSVCTCSAHTHSACTPVYLEHARLLSLYFVQEHTCNRMVCDACIDTGEQDTGELEAKYNIQDNDGLEKKCQQVHARY